MRKLKRLFLFLLVVALMAIAVVLSPFTQREVAIHYLRKYFSNVYLEGIFIGPNIAKIKGLSVSKNGLDFRVSHCTAKWSLKDLIFLRELKIKSIESNDLLISYHSRDNKGSLAEQKAVNFSEMCTSLGERVAIAMGFLKFIGMPKLPLRTTIDRIKLDGLIDLQELVFVNVTLEGGGLAPLGTAVIDVKSDVGVEARWPLAVDVEGQIKIFQSEKAVLDDIELNAKCTLLNRKEALSEEFNVNFAAKEDADGSSHHFGIGNKAEDPLCFSSVKFNRKEKRLFVEHRHDFDMNIFSEILKDKSLPKFETEARLNGEFDLNNWDGLLKVSGRVSLGNGITNSFLPPLESNLLISAESIFKMTKGSLAMSSFDGIYGTNDDSIKILCHSATPLVIWDKNSGLLIDKSLRDAGKSLGKIDIRSFNPKFAVDSSTGTKMDALVTGQFDISSKDGTITLKSCEDYPLMLKNFTFVRKAKKYLENVDVSCSVALSFGEMVQAVFDDVSMVAADGEPIFVGSGTFSLAAAKHEYAAGCEAVCQLPSLCKLPLFASMGTIESGICSGYVEIEGTPNSTKGKGEVKLKALLHEKRTTPLSGEGIVDFSYAPSALAANVGLNVSGVHRTSANMVVETSGDLKRGPMEAKFELKGDSISIEELKDILEPPLGISKSKAKGSKLYAWTEYLFEADENGDQVLHHAAQPLFAPWSKIKANGVVEIGKIFLGDSFVIDKLECCCVVDDTKIDLKTINFRIAESPFNAEAKLEYGRNNGKDPYTFSARSTFASKNIGKICKLIDESGPAVMEGAGEFSLELDSEGSNPKETVNSAQGKFTLECRNGLVRPTRLLTAEQSAIADVISIIGMFSVGKNDRYISMAALIPRLQSVDYDSIKINVRRKQDLNVIIDECTMIGPEIFIDVSGEIPYVEHKNFMDFPLTMAVAIDAAGDLGESLDAFGLIHDKPKGAMYMCGPRFVVKGTIHRLDFSDFARVWSLPYHD